MIVERNLVVLEKFVIFIACSVVVGNTMLNAEQKEWAVVTMVKVVQDPK